MSFLGYLTLFLTAFGAATILPGSSEVVLSALLIKFPESLVPLVLVAITGNTLGAALNWLIGRFLIRFKDRRWFPASPKRLDQATALFERYGYPVLLLSWVPLIGDAFTLAAGLLRARFLPFLILVLIGKGARYAALGAGIWFGMGLED